MSTRGDTVLVLDRDPAVRADLRKAWRTARRFLKLQRLAPLASFIMNLTDRAPSDLTHPFRQATWLEPRTRMERLISFVNHQTAATHLTHHLFPQVHWIHMRRLQRRMGRLYVRYGAPRSMVLNSTLLGNPLALARVLGGLKRVRPVGETWDEPPPQPSPATREREPLPVLL